MENLYESDYHGWIARQRELLKNNRLNELDIPNLLEAMEQEMGNNHHTLESHLKILLLHLLKYQHQVEVINPVLPVPYNCREWFASIDRARDDIRSLLRRNPSLKRETGATLCEVYHSAKRMAIKEMNRYVQKHQQLDNNSYPPECPWIFEQVIEDDWLPCD
ncbi:DUF29 domain-containing protein [Endozoicomonas sp. ALC020]|uniref:DUF29 domain-containing protein n=1 Tax=unclassified Endozoicomonas TaxID=2644528 RepID=UPI003BB1155B